MQGQGRPRLCARRLRGRGGRSSGEVGKGSDGDAASYAATAAGETAAGGGRRRFGRWQGARCGRGHGGGAGRAPEALVGGGLSA